MNGHRISHLVLFIFSFYRGESAHYCVNLKGEPVSSSGFAPSRVGTKTQTCSLSSVFFRAAKFVKEEDLDDVLCEFDAVIEDFTSPVEKRHFRYDEHLKTVKRRSCASVSDSGISDSESE